MRTLKHNKTLFPSKEARARQDRKTIIHDGSQIDKEKTPHGGKIYDHLRRWQLTRDDWLRARASVYGPTTFAMTARLCEAHSANFPRALFLPPPPPPPPLSSFLIDPLFLRLIGGWIERYWVARRGKKLPRVAKGLVIYWEWPECVNCVDAKNFFKAGWVKGIVERVNIQKLYLVGWIGLPWNILKF